MNIDRAIKKDESPKITNTNTTENIMFYEKWEGLNRLNMMFIKTKISTGIRGSVD